MAHIIAVFPGLGKTYYYKHCTDRIVLDSDSSYFSWTYLKYGTRERNKAFPENYINYIDYFDRNSPSDTIILTSTHRTVLEELENRNENYDALYPLDSVDDYVKRLEKRHEYPAFINNMAKNYDNYINDIKEVAGEKAVGVQVGFTLSDMIGYR